MAGRHNQFPRPATHSLAQFQPGLAGFVEVAHPQATSSAALLEGVGRPPAMRACGPSVRSALGASKQSCFLSAEVLPCILSPGAHRRVLPHAVIRGDRSAALHANTERLASRRRYDIPDTFTHNGSEWDRRAHHSAVARKH